jgi:predicted esterase|eukprot:Transcript_23453.p1 GENE.Transcript_23453~~Transcript_23453.p1  ORF type:complete len:281 (+),score=92.22 Transcript_23453:94-936(+)
MSMSEQRSVRPLLAQARGKRSGCTVAHSEVPGKRPRRVAAIRAKQAWELDNTTSSLVYEAESNCTAAVIWLHGLDDTPEPWANRLAAERRRRPTWKWVHLRAPERPITCYNRKMHSAWGDFVDGEKLRVGSKDHNSDDPKGWFAESVALVHSTVASLEAEGVPARNIAIVGFSQGAALAAQAALTLTSTPLGGWGMLSGWLPKRARQQLSQSANGRNGARVLICHSPTDEEVDMGCARLASKLLNAAGSEVEFKQLEDTMHIGTAAAGQRHALAFLDEIL